MSNIVRPGWVYVALRDDGLRKVGFTTDVQQRMSDLARQGLCLFALEHTQRHEDARLVEKVTHFLMRPHRAFPGTVYMRETYRTELSEAVSAISDACFLVETCLLPDFNPRKPLKQPRHWFRMLSAQITSQALYRRMDAIRSGA